MVDELLIVLRGLLAITLITGIGRWCRSHPGRPDELPTAERANR